HRTGLLLEVFQHRLSPIMNAQLFVDVFEMIVDREYTEAEGGSDFLVEKSFADIIENLLLARGQMKHHEMIVPGDRIAKKALEIFPHVSERLRGVEGFLVSGGVNGIE